MSLHQQFLQANQHRLRDAPLYRWNPTFGNPPWEESGLRVLILRLSAFRDVERSSPHLFLAAAVRHAANDVFVDMAFLPQRQDRGLMRAAGAPLVLGTQSLRSLQDFDLVLVSNSCIPEIVNLPFLLRGSGVPLWASERGPGWPAILLGGSSSAAAHGLVREDGDCMADALFFGEGEGAVQSIVAGWREAVEGDRLERLARTVPGLWPAGNLSRHVQRAVSPEGHPAFLPYPLLPGTEAGTARLAITHGCPCLCTFCFEGFDRGPFRQAPVPGLLSAARSLKAASGAESVDLVSFNFNTHEGIAELLVELGRVFLRVNAMSQRADILAREPGLLDCEIAAGKRSFTLGIEGVSQRMRHFLHKSLDGTDIHRVLEALHARRVREIKLFFLLTGREIPSDLEELAELARWLKGLRGGAGPRLIFSFGLLVRMPFTPLRHDRLFLEEGQWRPLVGRAKSICETHGFEFRLSTSLADYRMIQVLAAGGYELSGLLEELARAEIAYDEEFPPRAHEILEGWLAGRAGALSAEKPADHPFPFGFLESDRPALFGRWEAAREGEDRGYCRRGSHRGRCEGCPGCTLAGPPAAKPRAAARPAPRAPAIAEMTAAKARLQPIHVQVLLPAEAASESSPWRNAWLLTRLLERCPGQESNVLSVRECLVTPLEAEGAFLPWFGCGVAAITAWDAEEVARLIDGPSGEGLPYFPSLLPAFVPGSWQSLSIRLTWGAEARASAAGRISAALEAQHAPVTIRREGAFSVMDPAPKSVKRRAILAGRYSTGEGPLVLELTFGHGFNPARLVAFLAGPGGAPCAPLELTGFTL